MCLTLSILSDFQHYEIVREGENWTKRRVQRKSGMLEVAGGDHGDHKLSRRLEWIVEQQQQPRDPIRLDLSVGLRAYSFVGVTNWFCFHYNSNCSPRPQLKRPHCAAKLFYLFRAMGFSFFSLFLFHQVASKHPSC